MIARINIGLQQDILEQNPHKSSTSFKQVSLLLWILYSVLVSRRLAQKNALIFAENGWYLMKKLPLIPNTVC